MAEFSLKATPAIPESAVETGATRLACIDPGAVQAIVLRADDPSALAKELSRLVGPLPSVGRSSTTPAGDAILRPARERAYLIGACPDTGPARTFYTLEQSDFWAMIELTGPGGVAVLERCWRPDLGDDAFPNGAVARSAIAQIATILHHRSDEDYRLMAPRSYAGSLFHALKTSMASAL